MKRLVRLAVAATILVALGIVIVWLMIGGGSDSIAFADVASALDHLRSATYDLTTEWIGKNGKSSSATGKGFFLAPAHERREQTIDLAKAMEVSLLQEKKAMEGLLQEKYGAGIPVEVELYPQMTKSTLVMISDGQKAKAIDLVPNLKTATVRDMKKMYQQWKLSPGEAPPDDFEMVRRIVREGDKAICGKIERLGTKEIDGRSAVGFHVHTPTNCPIDLTFWADAQTARPVRIEFSSGLGAQHRLVMSNFRYDVDLDPSLFSVDVPAGYVSQTVDMKMPAEGDLLRTLRTIAERNKGMFPAKLGCDEGAMKGEPFALVIEEGPLDKATNAKLDAVMKKMEAKYGNLDKLRAKNQLTPEILAEIEKATKSVMPKDVPKPSRKDIQDGLEESQRLTERMQGLCFYDNLTARNDSHYVGGGVKLGTPDRPIFWYKPDGAKKYRVIYADLSVKEMSGEEVKKLSGTKAK